LYFQDYDHLKERFESLKQENEAFLDKYKRALADIENCRKRGERQVEETRIFAIQGFCKDLLEVYRNLSILTIIKQIKNR
jgi:molecular chaperone GrpE